MERVVVKISQKFCLNAGDILQRISDKSYCTLIHSYENNFGSKYFYFKDAYGTFSVNNKIMGKFFKNKNMEFILYEETNGGIL